MGYRVKGRRRRSIVLFVSSSEWDGRSVVLVRGSFWRFGFRGGEGCSRLLLLL